MRFATPKFYLANLVAFFVVLIITLATSAKADDNNPPKEVVTNSNQFEKADFNEDSIVLYQISLANGLLVSEAISGYQSKDKLFLSLKEFSDALQFPIKIEDNGIRASGWFLEETKHFSLDLNQRLSIADNKQYILSPDSIINHQGDIFVETKLLEQWFPLKISVNSLTQILIINATEPLPVELKLEREQRWELNKQEKDLQEREKTKDLTSTTIRTPYKGASLPLADIRYGYTYTKPQTGPIVRKSQLDTLLSGDFLYLNHQFFATTSNIGGVSSARLTSGRKDPDGNLLGPLHATQFSLGDVYTPQVPLAARSQIGKGGSVSNYPEGYITQFDNVPIIGNAQPGWDVELYRNDSLLNFLTVPDNGIYQFDAVPLVSGVNIIKLLFYGPFGQRREETKKYYMNENLVKQGQFLYRFTTNKNNETLITIPTKGNADPKDGINRYFTEATYGLTKATSIAANFLELPQDNTGIKTDYTTASIRSSLFGVFGRFDWVKNLTDKSNATETSLQARIFDFDITGKYDKFDKDFVSEEHQTSTDALLSKTSLRIDGSFKVPHIPSIRTSTSLTQQHFQSLNDQYDFSQEFATTITNKLNITQNFQYTLNESATDRNHIIESGRTLLNYRAGSQLSLRGFIDYNMKPETELSSSTGTADYRFLDNYNLNLNVTHQFATSTQKASNTYTANLSKMFDSLITSLGGNYGNLTGYGINLNLSFSFGYDTKYKVGALSPTPIANNGAIAAKAFLDNNNNDIYDKGDELLPNVKFAVDGMTGARATNENGVTFVPGVPAVSKISISPESLDDPSWMSKRSKATIISHPGSIINLEYPISPTGEVEGTVYISNNGQTIGASNVILELVSDKGVLTKTTTSSFDGYYILSEVPFGNYKMRISQAQLERLGLGANTFYKIIINADNSSLENYNFTIGKDIVNKVDKVTKPKVKFKIKQFPKNEKDTEVRDLEDIVNPGKAAQHQTFKFKEQKEKREMIFTPIETPKIKFKVNKIESENTPKSGKKGYVFKKGESPQEQPKSPETKKFNIKNIERKPSIKEIKKLKKESKKPKTTKSKKENKKSSGKSGTNKSKKENKKKKPKAREHTFKIDPSTLN